MHLPLAHRRCQFMTTPCSCSDRSSLHLYDIVHCAGVSFNLDLNWIPKWICGTILISRKSLVSNTRKYSKKQLDSNYSRTLNCRISVLKNDRFFHTNFTWPEPWVTHQPTSLHVDPSCYWLVPTKRPVANALSSKIVL